MGTCLAMGHGVGVAAAQAIKDGVAARSVNMRRVQEILLRQGAYLGERLQAIATPAPVPKQRS